jgi:septal ring factor EnvC (AmiA/AmiB activator)
MNNNSLLHRKVNIKQFVAIFIALAVLLIANPFAFGQTKKKKKTKPKTETADQAALAAKKKDILAQIDFITTQKKNIQRKKTLSLAELVALNMQISTHESLITEINNEINALDLQIADNMASITQLDTEVAQLKRSYARMIVFAYRNQDSYQRMMFIFSADNFNQAFLRMRYMQQIGESRQQQAEKIADREQTLNENIRNLQDQKAQKKDLLGSSETEKEKLASEKDEKDKTFRGLQTKEQELQTELANKNKEKQKIDAAIQAIIVASVTPPVPKPVTPTPTNPNPKPTPIPPTTLGASFGSSQGSLPWPVEKGSITGHFGKQPHPVLQDVYVYNNGIDIATTADASARAVYEGEVTGVTNIAGSGWLVIVRSGEYLTVYAKLEEVFVKKGDKVTMRQNLGKVAMDSEEGQAVLHFEVWKSGQDGVSKMDPEAWLLKR